MKLFGLNLRFPFSTLHSPSSPRSPLQRSNASTLQPSYDPSPSPCLSHAYQQLPWVYRAINVLAEQVASTPFLFSSGERGREHLITSGPLHDFYNQPHPLISRFQYWELRVIWLMLRGECIRIPIFEDSSHLRRNLFQDLETSDAQTPTLAHPMGEGSRVRATDHATRDRRHAPSHPASTPEPRVSSIQHRASSASFASLRFTPAVHHSTTPSLHHSRLKSVLILDPSHFHHIIEDQELIGWRYTGLGPNPPLQDQVFLPDEVWFDRLPNPFSFWRGLSPLTVAAIAARTDFAAAAFMQGIIENNCDTGLVLRTDQQLSPEQHEQILAALRDRKRRAGTPDRPLLLSNSLELVPPSLSSADLQLLETRRFSRSEICAAFGVPEDIVATSGNAKYDVLAGSRLNFIENRVAPLCARLAADEDLTVKTIDPSASGWFDLDSLPIMHEARRHRLAAAKTAFDMGVPVNEINRVLDLGIKPLPWGDRAYLPTRLNPIPHAPS